MPSALRWWLTGWFIALALWGVFTVARPDSRFSGVRNAAGSTPTPQQKRVIASPVTVLMLGLAVIAWTTTK